LGGVITSADQAQALFARFLRWWGTELLALIPERLKQLTQRRGCVVLMPDGAARFLLFVETPNELVPIGQFNRSEGADPRAPLHALLQRPAVAAVMGRGTFDRCLRLPSQLALRQTIELPLAADANLTDVVGFELDRYTPFRAEHVHFCYRVLNRDVSAQRLIVDITVVPKATVDEALEAAAEVGWLADRVDVAGANPNDDHSDNLIAGKMPSGYAGGARMTRRLAAAALVLTAIAVAMPLVMTQYRATVMSAEFAALQKQIQTDAALRQELISLRNTESYLLNRKVAIEPVSLLLLEATRILPDNTWLTEFRLSGAEIEFAGVTASASALIGLLEKSGIFRDTSFRSPVIPDRVSGGERFNIAAHLVSGGPH
jgi:general secretion pathway protein L